MYSEILAAGVFTQDDASAFTKLKEAKIDAALQAMASGLRTRFNDKITDLEQRKSFVYLLARFVKSFHFLTCFFTYPPELREFADFAEFIGPQLIKQGSVSDLMKQIRRTEVTKASVQFQGVVTSTGPTKQSPGKGKKSSGVPPKKVSVQEMIAEIREKYVISDDEALYIREVTEEKSKDENIRATVQTHRDDRIYLESSFQGQVNGQIQSAYAERGRYDELADDRYTDTGAIFDIMALTVIQNHLVLTA